jgi:hypothetical protein
MIDREIVLRLAGLVLILVVAVVFVIGPSFKELRHVRRRIRLQRELAATPRGPRDGDPARCGVVRDHAAARVRHVLDGGHRSDRRVLAAVHELSPSHGGVDVDQAARLDRVVGITLARRDGRTR